MSIRFNASATTSPIAALLERLDGVNALVADVGRDVAADYVPILEREMATNVPPKRRKEDKVKWTSDNQRMAFFASGGFGKGIPYQRSGALADGWTIDVTTEGGIFTIKIRNPAPGAKFVYGSLAKNPAAARRPQQQFHRDTGWPLAVDIIRPMIDDMLEDFKQRIRDEIGELTSVTGSGSRAYTGR